MGNKVSKASDHLLIKLRKIMKKGDKKSSTFAAEEALKFYRRSLDNLQKQKETPAILNRKTEMRLLLGEILYILGKWDEALSYLRKVQEMPEDKVDPLKIAEAYRKSGTLWALKGDIDQVFDDYKKALQISKKLKDPVGIADSERGLGYAYWRRGNIPEAEKHYEMAFRALQGQKDPDLLAKTYLESGNVYNDKGDLDKAVDYYMKAIRVFRRTKDLYQEARAYNNLGDVCIKRKDWRKGIRYFEKTAALADSINDLHMHGWALFNAAECHAKGGNLEKAEDCCTKALDMLSRIDDKIGIAYVFCNYGITYRFKKEWAKSTKYFKFSLNIVRNLKTPGLEAYVLKEYAEMLNDWNKKDKAKQLTIDAMRIYTNMGAKYYVEEMNALLARIEGRQYEMDIKVKDETLEVVQIISDIPKPEVETKAQEPIIVKDGRASKVKGSDDGVMVSDDGYVKAPAKGARTVEGAAIRGPVGKEAEVEKATPGAKPEEPKVLLFMPRDEDDALRRQKVRFFVELPFVAPELEVEEVREGERTELASKMGVTEYPSLALYGRIFPGIPSAKDLADLARAQRKRRRPGKEVKKDPGKAKAAPKKKAKPKEPAAETKVPTAPVTVKGEKVDFHYSYLLEDETHDRAVEIFKGILDRGAKGLCVTRPPTRKLKDRFGHEDIEFLLLSTSDPPRKGQHFVKNIKEIGEQIESFMDRHGTSVVLIDRAQVLIQHATFDGFLRMIHMLNECLDHCKSCLLVPLDPHLIGNMEMRTLRRELTKL
jgi:tetratricopeptide (TPR) repeat protein